MIGRSHKDRSSSYCWRSADLPWKEKASFLFRYVLDPWVFACWAVLFVVGEVTRNIYWNFFTLFDGESIVFHKFSVPWFFSNEIASDQRHQIESSVYDITYTGIKICIYGGLLFASIKIRPDAKKPQDRAYLTIVAAFVVLWFYQRSSIILSGDGNCANSNALIFSPYFTPLGFSIPFIYSWLVAPLWEEMTFRGLMFNWLQHRSGIFRVVLTSVLFAYVHLVGKTGLMFPTTASIFGSFAMPLLFSWLPMGLLFGYAREKTGGILVPFILHSATNMLIDIEAVLLLASGHCPAP